MVDGAPSGNTRHGCQRVAADLRRKDLSREKVMATILRLLETTLIRVGNEEHARQNGSYGLTILHNRHARVNGTQITFYSRARAAGSTRSA